MVWNRETGARVRSFTIQGVYPRLSMNGTYDMLQIETGRDRFLQIWNVASGQIYWIPEQEFHVLTSSPDEKQLITGGGWGLSPICDLVNRGFLGNYGWPRGGTSAAFSQDGNTLAVAENNGTSRFSIKGNLRRRLSSRRI